MSSPARGVRFIHSAIRAEIDALEAAAWSRALDDGWVDRASFLERVVHLHTTGEEQSTFADLARVAPESAAPYLLDHEIERELFGRAIDGARCGDGDACARAMTALARHVHTHIQKEEDLVIPLLEKHFTIPELGAQAGRMMAAFPPEEMAKVVPWLFGRLSPEDRIAYGAMVAAVMPPERLPTFVGWARSGITEAEAAAVAAAVPAFATGLPSRG